jgi:hypothetical protein
VRVEGQLVFNNIALRLSAVLAGLGLAYLPANPPCGGAARPCLDRLVPAISPVTISITRVDASPPRLLTSSSMRSATEFETERSVAACTQTIGVSAKAPEAVRRVTALQRLSDFVLL